MLKQGAAAGSNVATAVVRTQTIDLTDGGMVAFGDVENVKRVERRRVNTLIDLPDMPRGQQSRLRGITKGD